MKDYPNERDCEHGHLRRSCPICAAESDYATLLTRHNALVEAVKKEIVARDNNHFWSPTDPMSSEELHTAYMALEAARAEVDRLITNNDADCKGEGEE